MLFESRGFKRNLKGSLLYNFFLQNYNSVFNVEMLTEDSLCIHFWVGQKSLLTLAVKI